MQQQLYNRIRIQMSEIKSKTWLLHRDLWRWNQLGTLLMWRWKLKGRGRLQLNLLCRAWLDMLSCLPVTALANSSIYITFSEKRSLKYILQRDSNNYQTPGCLRLQSHSERPEHGLWQSVNQSSYSLAKHDWALNRLQLPNIQKALSGNILLPHAS